ncbi:hypothetical protein HK405_003380, partial [Cladochytrium tenue]
MDPSVGGGAVAGGARLSLQYPPPPPFYQLFTDANLDDHRRRKAAGIEPALPLDPPPPLVGSYTMFGETLDTRDRPPTLRELGIPQLVSDDPADRARELKDLNSDLLLAYLDLTGALASRPAEFLPKLEHLRVVLINLHYALNAYRPHQARDVLRLMLELQARRRRETADKIR